MKLLQSVREEFNVPDLPFIAGDFVQHYKMRYINICPTVSEVSNAVRDVCRDCGQGAFVETNGLLSNMQELGRQTQGWADDIHFSRKSIYKLGKRYFDAYVKILNG